MATLFAMAPLLADENTGPDPPRVGKLSADKSGGATGPSTASDPPEKGLYELSSGEMSRPPPLLRRLFWSRLGLA